MRSFPLYLQAAFSIVGLGLSAYGVMLISVKGFMAKPSRIRYFLAFLLSKQFLSGQPVLDREPTYGLSEEEFRGWRCLAWGFILQILGAAFGLVQQLV